MRSQGNLQKPVCGRKESVLKKSKSYIIFQIVNTILMALIVCVMLYPFLYLLAKSFSSEAAIYAGKVFIFPVEFTTETYRVLLKQRDFFISYKNTIIYTLIGTALSLFLSCMLAYPLSKNKLIIRKFITPMIIFTMFFAGGMIPNFVLINKLGLRNSMWAVILPTAINVYYVLVMRSFFVSLPEELEEAAAVDGLNTYGIFFRIILPLSKPILATMLLFYAVDTWNSWFPAFLYLDNKEAWPVTLFLRQIVEGAAAGAVEAGSDEASKIGATVRSAAMILTALPIISIYPFVQKYFVQGMMMGSVKG